MEGKDMRVNDKKTIQTEAIDKKQAHKVEKTQSVLVLKSFSDIGVKHKQGETIIIQEKDLDFYKSCEKMKFVKFI